MKASVRRRKAAAYLRSQQGLAAAAASMLAQDAWLERAGFELAGGLVATGSHLDRLAMDRGYQRNGRTDEELREAILKREQR